MNERILFCDCRVNKCKDALVSICKEVMKITTLDNDKSIDWNLKTKYYEATVSVDIMSYTNLQNSDIYSNYGGVVLLTNSTEENIQCFKETWTKLQSSSDIRLLAVEDNVESNFMYEWCLEHEFELVELHQSPDSDENEDALDDQGWGVNRLRSALLAHEWRSSGDEEDAEEVKRQDEGVVEGTEQQDEFEDLFRSLGDFRTRIGTAKGEDRLRMAEEATKMFLRAMGDVDEDM